MARRLRWQYANITSSGTSYQLANVKGEKTVMVSSVLFRIALFRSLTALPFRLCWSRWKGNSLVRQALSISED